MRKIASQLLILVLCLSLWSCGTNSDPASLTNSIPSTAQEPLMPTPVQIEETNTTPPTEQESLDIVLSDGRFYLCRKEVSGFNENAEYYGIYDSLNELWAMEYTELDTYDMEVHKFQSHGNGMFSYIYSSYYGTLMFLSADLGGTFKTSKHVFNQNSIYFDNGKALVLFAKDARFDGGTLTPDNEMVWMDTYGQTEPFYFDELGADAPLYWCDFSASGESTDVYVREVHTYINDVRTYYIFAYFYDTNQYVLIDDQEYASRMGSTAIKAFCSGDLLRITNITGDDGEEYYAEFNRDGNLVTPATLMN